MTESVTPQRFVGNYEMSLDAKGRVSIPAPYNKILQACYEAEQGNLVATLTPERSVAIYPFSVWDASTQKYQELSDLDQAARNVNRIRSAHTFFISPDGNNRIRLPQQLMTVCGIERDVTVVGSHKFFEIWNRKAWDEYAAIGIENLAESSQKALQR